MWMVTIRSMQREREGWMGVYSTDWAEAMFLQAVGIVLFHAFTCREKQRERVVVCVVQFRGNSE